MRRPLSAALAALIAALPTIAPAHAAPRNIIVMIADGAGYNALQATRLYTGKPLAVDAPRFRATSASTSPLRLGNDPVPGAAGLAQDPDTLYDPAKNWSAVPVAGDAKGYPRGFQGYEWNRRTAPDSANTMSAMANGTKSYNNAVNVDGNGAALRTVAEAYHARGGEAGVVTTVELDDATPAAAGGAHNVSRKAHGAIADEMFGAGNPDYDDDARPRAIPDYDWIDASLWSDLKAGGNASGHNAAHWTLLQDRAAIQAVADGRVAPPAHLAMVAHAFEGANAYRAPGLKPATTEPFAEPMVAAQPTLTELTRAALRRLDRRGGKDFFLMAEGGAVDRAEHRNNLGCVIETYVEFDNAVHDVVAWIGKGASGASWRNTLLIVTADHDHLLFGPDAATTAYQPVQPNPAGAGHLPLHRWMWDAHSNQLVPLYSAGAGSADVLALAIANDTAVNAAGGPVGRGRYLDQAALGRLLLSFADAGRGDKATH